MGTMTDNSPLVLTHSDDRRHQPPLTIAQTAAFLNVDVRWVRRAVFERRIPYYKVGRFIRFDPADLDRFLTQSRVPAAQSSVPRRVAR